MDKAEILGLLEGHEIDSVRYEGVVGITDGQVVYRGEVIDPDPSETDAHILLDEYMFQEFGTTNVGSLVEDEFGG